MESAREERRRELLRTTETVRIPVEALMRDRALDEQEDVLGHIRCRSSEVGRDEFAEATGHTGLVRSDHRPAGVSWRQLRGGVEERASLT